MNLKEAFHYQNYLDSLLDGITRYLSTRDNVMKTEETHYRRESNPDATNETKDVTPTREFAGYSVEKLVGYMQAVADEKMCLTAKVDTAKREYKELAYDVAIMNNKTRQRVANVLHLITSLKPNETMTTAKGYKFNVAGDQVSYYYDMKTVRTIDFDRNHLRKLTKDYLDKANQASAMLDEALLNINIAFEPQFDVNDSFEESVIDFLGE